MNMYHRGIAGRNMYVEETNMSVFKYIMVPGFLAYMYLGNAK